ncbi:MAG: hypothetical protein J7L34_02515 [Thermotogaceae bacterium]|nr:hypothetical protein [Thermotogaceae bacterium]
MKVKSVLILVVLISAIAFSMIPTLYPDNPVFVFETPRECLDISDMNAGLGLSNNLITIDDINRLLTGEKIVFDATRLEMIGNDGFLLFPKVLVSDYIGLGIGNVKLGVNAKISANITANLPVEAMRFIFGDYDFGESLSATFTLFKGGIFGQGGALFGLKLGSFSMAVEGGAYVPLIVFDKDSKSLFYYSSNEDEGSFEIALKGDQKLYSLLNSLDSPTFSSEDLSNAAGYYLNFGIMWDVGDFKVAAALNNFSIKPANLEYSGYVYVTFEASYSNFEFNSATPVVEYTEGELQQLEEPIELTIPYEVNLFASYEWSVFDFAFHGKLVPDMDYSEYGGYISLWNMLWADFTYLPGGLWKKEAGLNIDIKALRLTAAAGVIDAGGIFNFDPSKMTGLSVNVGVGIGF